ncbi:hypothetical protein ACSBOB_01470 [Mesorhizobium sp. ASY16-5R]|uniref:hypothetical protein n=1 Tax=Mesorhizobium sp. ASY16-5R TaxID=3445772 RepID=UPI003FA13497
MEAWLADDFGRPFRARRYLKGFYYNRLPRDFRFAGVLHWLAKTSLASSAPAVAFYYGSVGSATAAITAAAIFGGHSIVSFLDRMSKDKAAGSSERQAEMMVRLGDLLNGFKGKSVASSDRDDVIRACLGILENYVRMITLSKKGDISVSLVLFVGASSTKMKVRHRNAGNDRPTNREFPATHLAGYRACQRGTEPRVVHDLREFPREAMVSPTQSAVTYRSIFIVPVASQTNDGPKVKGFVSIDSPRPYAFYGNRSNMIMVTCEPVFSRINELI